ncbi:protocadherin beta-16-like [Thamnophis elegans]|uniref:protocadherin beta-16-like n=1 Tax=Thamnophis elegans TaxID=35005 RepID=UPI001376AB0C|nr:protocadherin beta-16-like [Thamnophis elegans]
MENCFWKRQGLYVLLSFSFLRVMCASIRFSVPEEKKKGFLVANVLKELKLKTGELTTRKAYLVAEGTQEYFHLDIQTGNLLTNDKIDREALCGQNVPCLLLSQLVLENPLDIFNIEIKIEDVNDNAPKFWKNEVKVDIPENMPINMIFPLELAQDDDLGNNSIQNYILSSNEHFQLEVQRNEDRKDNIYLVLKKTLDRERMPHLELILMAIDGGVPKKTGTVQININVLDNNDNFPLFSKSEYKARIKENLPKGTPVIKVEATDLDLGSNAQILYLFHQVPERINNLFHLNEITGEITVWGDIDYEKEKSYSMSIRATDGGGLPGQCDVLIEVEDENDNPPEVSIMSLISTLKEDSPPDTMVALLSVRDQDSGDNSKTICSVQMNLPFVLKATTNNFYQLVLQSPLDRETVTEYNITITAIDWGAPRLTSTRLINVQISDVNDNSPLFEKSSYDMQIRENNIPGLLIGSVHALDLDTTLNAKVNYLVLPGKGDGMVTSYISINSETGNMYALRSLDYEQIRGFRVTVRASDGGSPSLSSEVIVRIHIIDENDNAPFFLYPLQNNTSPCNELLPKSAEAGYLVTKVVAVDADSGQNSWLSYELLKATDPALFSIGAQNGEVKTRRVLNERDISKQRLVILVRDNGLPPQTSTVLLNVLLVDGFSDPFLRRVDVSVQEPEEDKTLTKYLVICLAAVSFVFLVCIVVFIVIKIFKKDPQSHFTTAVPHFPTASSDTPGNCADSQNGSLSRTYRYDVCLTGGSLSSEFRFLRPLFPVFSVGDVNVPGNSNISSGIQDTSEQVAVNGAEKETKEICYGHSIGPVPPIAGLAGSPFVVAKLVEEKPRFFPRAGMKLSALESKWTRKQAAG